MTDLPQWAMEKANEHLERWKFDSMTIVFARALVEAEARGIERAAKVLEEGYEMDVAEPYRGDRKPSKHDKCSHGKYHWEDCEHCALIAIRKLMEQDNG